MQLPSATLEAINVLRVPKSGVKSPSPHQAAQEKPWASLWSVTLHHPCLTAFAVQLARFCVVHCIPTRRAAVGTSSCGPTWARTPSSPRLRSAASCCSTLLSVKVDRDSFRHRDCIWASVNTRWTAEGSDSIKHVLNKEKRNEISLRTPHYLEWLMERDRRSLRWSLLKENCFSSIKKAFLPLTDFKRCSIFCAGQRQQLRIPIRVGSGHRDGLGPRHCQGVAGLLLGTLEVDKWHNRKDTEKNAGNSGFGLWGYAIFRLTFWDQRPTTCIEHIVIIMLWTDSLRSPGPGGRPAKLWVTSRSYRSDTRYFADIARDILCRRHLGR